MAQHKQGISGLYSLSSFNQSGKFLYVTFLVVSNTCKRKMKLNNKNNKMFTNHTTHESPCTSTRMKDSILKTLQIFFITITYQYTGMCLMVVWGMHVVKPFLPCSVPEIWNKNSMALFLCRTHLLYETGGKQGRLCSYFTEKSVYTATFPALLSCNQAYIMVYTNT